jgi:hypothetical protein
MAPRRALFFRIDGGTFGQNGQEWSRMVMSENRETSLPEWIRIA